MHGIGFRVYGLGATVEGLWFGVYAFWASGQGFIVWGVWFELFGRRALRESVLQRFICDRSYLLNRV